MGKARIQLPKPGEVVEITARHCGAKVSPLLQTGEMFTVKNLASLGDGTPVLEVAHPKRKNAVLRVNAARFEWRVVTPGDLKERAFTKEVAAEAKRLLSDFTREEQINIAFVPLIFNHIAWVYAMQAVQMCADQRIDELKKVTRCVRQLRKAYMDEVCKDLDLKHQGHVERETERFMAEFHHDFTILYFAVNGEMKRKMPDCRYDEMRTLAVMSMLMVRFVDEHNKRMDALIASRLGGSKPSLRMPVMDALYACMDAYASVSDDFDYGFTDIETSMEIIRLRLQEIEFEII